MSQTVRKNADVRQLYEEKVITQRQEKFALLRFFLAQLRIHNDKRKYKLSYLPKNIYILNNEKNRLSWTEINLLMNQMTTNSHVDQNREIF